MHKLYFVAILTFAFLKHNLSFAQANNKLTEIAQNISTNKKNKIDFIILKENQRVYESNAEAFLNSIFPDNGLTAVKKFKTDIDALGFTHTKYQLFYNNTIVNDAIIITHSQNGKIITMNGELNPIQKPINNIVINEQSALQKTLKKINAKSYKWQNKTEEQQLKLAFNNPDFSYYPKGELILYTREGNAQETSLHYAYKFTIYADEPLYAANVIVDAQNGAILAEQNLICSVDVPSIANTKYSAVQSFTTDNFGTNQYRLRETGRGLGIETYNMNNGTNYGAATDFTNTSTNWPATAPTQTGEDGHWGAEMTYDYFKNVHSRNSIDNAGYKLISYVHYSINYNNAFWNNLYMTYGDGDGTSFTDFTALDICGHEITHGLTKNTAGLGGGGSGEPGALNEGFSDIFGTTIENFARPGNWDWKLGGEITPGGAGLRNMSNPKLLGQPNCYMGINWDPGQEVHQNNGPCIYWYYLLCQGGSGINDNANSYTVNALGMTTAAKIAFRALTVYFVPTTNYASARTYAIQAAKDLYGNCSNEVYQTENAWYAVGVGAAATGTLPPVANFNSTAGSLCSLPVSVNFINASFAGDTYTWDFGDGTAVSTATNPVHSYTANGTYSVKLKTVALCSPIADSITKVAYITVNAPPPPVATGSTTCGPGSVNLSASGTFQQYWYATPSGTGTPLFIGNNYATPFIGANTTYYVVNTGTNAATFGGPPNTAIGTGVNFPGNTAYDSLTVLQPCTLRSFVVTANSTANRTFQLRNYLNAVISSTTVNVPAGTSTVIVNIKLNPGSYRLGLANTSIAQLYRNNTGAVYPYNIGGLVKITGCSSGSPYFYFFYNWEVVPDNCTSSTVAVTASVIPGPTITVNSPSICIGQNVNLTASGLTNYTWSTGATTSSINVSPTVTTTYTISGDNGGCTRSQTTIVTADPTPTLVISSATICTGQNTNLTASGASTYSWNTGATVNNITVNPLTNTVYTLTGSNGGCSVTNTTGVMVNPTPTLTVNSEIICAGQTATLTASGAATYSWSSGQTGNAITVSPATNTLYTIYGYNGVCNDSIVSNITVNPLPNVTLTANHYTVCLSDSMVNLNGLPFGGIYSGAGVTAASFDPLVAGVGTFVVTYNYTDGNNCSGTNSLSIIVSPCTGIHELNNSNSFSIYPNPANDFFVVNSINKNPNYNLKLMDATGKLILEKVIIKQTESIDINKLAKGIYFIEIQETALIIYRTKIVKQ